MAYTSDLLAGLAQLIAGAGLGTYRPTGVYTSAETGITIAVVPEAPDRLICLTPYPVDDTGLTDVITGVQIRMRAGRNPTDVSDLADNVRDLFHNRRGFTAGAVLVTAMWRESQALLGQDEHGRIELASNYYVRGTRPGPHLYE